VAVPLPFAPGEASEASIRAAFETAYAAAFSRLLQGIPVRLATLRAIAVGRRPPIDLAALAPAPGGTVEAARSGTRCVWFDGAWHEAAVYERLELPVGARIEGPAILEQADATIVVDPGLAATVDPLGNLVLRRA
jgi:N-methylhydantoinase A